MKSAVPPTRFWSGDGRDPVLGCQRQQLGCWAASAASLPAPHLLTTLAVTLRCAAKTSLAECFFLANSLNGQPESRHHRSKARLIDFTHRLASCRFGNVVDGIGWTLCHSFASRTSLTHHDCLSKLATPLRNGRRGSYRADSFTISSTTFSTWQR